MGEEARGEFVVLRRLEDGNRNDADAERRAIISEHGHDGRRDPQLSVVRLSTYRGGWGSDQNEWTWAVVAHVSQESHRRYVEEVGREYAG